MNTDKATKTNIKNKYESNIPNDIGSFTNIDYDKMRYQQNQRKQQKRKRCRCRCRCNDTDEDCFFCGLTVCFSLLFNFITRGFLDCN